MLAQITELLDANLGRVENLIGLYGIPRAGRRTVNETDVLRAALVLLHASMEDFLRSLLIWRAPLGSKELIATFPLVGSKKKQSEKFDLGALVAHKNKTVHDLIVESIREYLEEYSSFNNLGEVKRALIQSGVLEAVVNAHNFEQLPEMILRRHNIVHKADRNEVQGGQGHHRTSSISASALKNYVSAIKSLKVFVEANLPPVG